MEDDKDTMRDEYDLKNMRIRRVGPGRTQFGGVSVGLEPDVAAVFPDANAVNEALRFLIKRTKENVPAPSLTATAS